VGGIYYLARGPRFQSPGSGHSFITFLTATNFNGKPVTRNSVACFILVDIIVGFHFISFF